MNGESIKEAVTVDEAIQAAVDELGVTQEEIEYEILVEPEKHVFGKNTNAKVRVWVSIEDTTETETEPSQSPAQNEDTTEEKDTKDTRSEDIEEGPEEAESTDINSDAAVETENEPTPSAPVICDEEKQPFFKDNEELSEEELDNVADTAITALREILAYFDAEDSTIDEYEGDEGEILLDVIGDDLAILIGRHGKTLDALQYAVTSATNKKLGFRYPVVIDIEGYKYRRKQKIEGLAKSAATKASEQGKSVRLRPMTPYERRIVHITLRDDKRVSTASEGEEPNRRVVVKPISH